MTDSPAAPTTLPPVSTEDVVHQHIGEIERLWATLDTMNGQLAALEVRARLHDGPPRPGKRQHSARHDPLTVAIAADLRALRGAADDNDPMVDELNTVLKALSEKTGALEQLRGVLVSTRQDGSEEDPCWLADCGATTHGGVCAVARAALGVQAPASPPSVACTVCGGAFKDKEFVEPTSTGHRHVACAEVA